MQNKIVSYLRAPAIEMNRSASPVDLPPHLTSIDFFAASLEVRKLVYRYLLVPSSGRIFFPDPVSSVSGGDKNPELSIAIIYANRQVYQEASRVLYGENRFVAAKPSDLFLPTGLAGLLRKTTGLIRHLAFERRGSAPDLCQETSQDVLTPIWKMVCQYPGLLGGLKKISIRREVLRPANFDFLHLQRYFVQHGDPVDTTPLYKKKDMIMSVAAGLAYYAATRAAEFTGMFIVEESDREIATPTHSWLSNAFELCLTKADNTSNNGTHGTPLNLTETVLGVLFEERENEEEHNQPSRAAKAYRWWRVNKCSGLL